jgi:glutathione synthase/RimK-type ligase-like ATP-grasp enzyme
MASIAKDKWEKYKYMNENEPLRAHLPETRMMTRRNLWEMLEKYKHVIVKPVWGSRGKGVIQVSLIGEDEYELHYERKKFALQGKADTVRYLKSKMRSASYMVQRRVSRPTINGCPFDMSVIIQRKRKSSEWRVTAKVIKVAGKGYIVSNNTRSKGRLLHFKNGIRKSSVNHLSADKLEADIDRIAIQSARRLSSLFPGHRIYGLDMGPDRKGQVWIIEANLYPAKSHFLKLKDRKMYRRILEYKKG